MAETNSLSATEPQHNRACDPCRIHKVRCFPDNSSASSKTCQRCARTDRRCVYTAPQRRKQRKRTDTRVAELEREVQAMRSLFERKEDVSRVAAGQSQTIFPVPMSSLQAANGSENPSTMGSHTLSSPQTLPSSNEPSLVTMSIHQIAHLSRQSISQSLDVIDRGIISLQLARELFHTYTTELVPHYPAVIFPPGVTAAEIRISKPTLFLAIMAATSGKSDPHLYSILNSEVLTSFAQKIVIGSQKSLELVQAMIVTSVWYYPPGKFAQLKFYECIHMAATMAVDIGLGTNPKLIRRRRVFPETEFPVCDASNSGGGDEIERRRTWLACYLITTGVSMSMRRPAMLGYNSWVGECLEFLEASPDAVASDKVLVGWVRLLIIAEEFATSLSFDDPGNMPSLSEPRIQLIVKSFERRLESWKDDVELNGKNDALLLGYYHANILLHELALHEDHPPEDFLPPFTIDHILLPDPERKMTPSYIDAISMCISSAHSLIEKMIGMSVESLRALPVFNFVRMAYAAIILTKLYVSVRCPTSKIGKVLDREALKIRIYLPAMIDRLSEAVGPMECRSPATFLGLISRLRMWYDDQEKIDEITTPVQLFCSSDSIPPKPDTFGCTSGYWGPEPTGIQVGREPKTTLQAKAAMFDPFRGFFGPDLRNMSKAATAHDENLDKKHGLEPEEPENSFLFDPGQTDFDLDSFLLPNEMDFLDVGANAWSTDMNESGNNMEGTGMMEPEINHWNSVG